MTPSSRAAGWAAILALPLALALSNWSDGAGYRAGDYAQYLLHAKALVDGRAYDDIGYIYTEANPVMGPRAYPPGLPAMLAPLLSFGSAFPVAVKCAMLALLLAFVALAGRYAAGREGLLGGMAVALICGAHAPIAEIAVFPLSDLPFCVLVVAIVLLADPPGRPSAARLVALAAAGSAVIAFRSIGVAVVPALLVHAVLRGRKEGGPFVLPAIACSAAFVGLNAWLPTASSYLDQVATSPTEIVRMNLEKLYHYRLGFFESVLYPFPWDRANDLYHLLTLGVVAVGGWEWVRRSSRSFYVLFAVCYAVLLVPYWIAVGRYLWPVLPLIAIAFVNGIRILARRWRPFPARISPEGAALAVAILLALPAAALTAAKEPLPSLETHGSAQQVFAFLEEENRRDPVRAVFFNPRVLALETGIPAMPMVPGSPEEIVEEMASKGITHVVVGDLGAGVTGAEDVRRAVTRTPSRFASAARFGELEVYRFRSEGSSAKSRSSLPEG